MSLITLQTAFTKNTSLQVGDIIYFLDTSGDSDVIRKIGPVQTIADNYIVCNATGNLSGLTQNSYISAFDQLAGANANGNGSRTVKR